MYVFVTALASIYPSWTSFEHLTYPSWTYFEHLSPFGGIWCIIPSYSLCRTVGGMPGVSVSEAESPISMSPLMADRHCGEGTRLIYYLNTGEMLSRTITSKDTHSVRGDLLVAYTDVDRVGQASVDRTRATMSVLGFSSPSFSFGMDIMLPAEINQQLRDLVVTSDADARGGKEEVRKMKGVRTSAEEDAMAVRAIGEVKGVFVPEVSCSRMEMGIGWGCGVAMREENDIRVNSEIWFMENKMRRGN